MKFQSIWAILYKNLLFMLRYKLDLVFWAVMPVMWLVPLILQGQTLVGGTTSNEFALIAGTTDYLTFIIIGNVLWQFVMSALWGAGNSIRWEQQSGTLEALWTSPISRVDLMVATTLSETIWALANVLMQFTLVLLILPINLNLTYVDIIASVVAMVLTLSGLFGFGILFAGIVLIFKDAEGLTDFTSMVLMLTTPVRYTLRQLPIAVRYVSMLFPFTIGLIIIRLVSIDGFQTFMAVSPLQLLGLLLLVDCFLWIVGIYFFERMERHTRKKGTLGSY